MAEATEEREDLEVLLRDEETFSPPKEFVEQAKDLDASFKEFIRSNADNAQGDLDKRLAEKHGAQ